MKNLKLIFVIIILTLTSSQFYSQEYNLGKKTITGVFEVEGKSKPELFSSINRWISINYNSAQSVVQLNDKEAGNIIVKGVNEAVYKHVTKELYPKSKYIKEYNTVKFKHTIEINVKDNKYRVIYSLTDILPPNNTNNIFKTEEIYNMIFNMIDFTGLKQDPIDKYNIYIDKIYKKSWFSKKKRQKFEDMTRYVFEEMNKSVVANIKSTMFLIQESAIDNKKDKW